MKKGTKKPNHFLALAIVAAVFITNLYYRHPEVFTYRFSPALIEKYQRSQDIPRDYHIRRIFLSDGDIHIAAGYLYARGESPVYYNFQHPPFIKYLYGASILLFQNPFVAQILLALGYIFLTYFLALKLKTGVKVALFASMLLALDPLLTEVSSQALLDLGQAGLSLLYLISAVFFPANAVLQGIVLGLFAAAKFWAAALFLTALVTIYKWYKKELDYRRFAVQVTVAFITFAAVYTKFFLDGNYNIIFLQAKMLKYWFHHSITSIPAASLIMFLTGYFKTWWGDQRFQMASGWSILWPVGLLISTGTAIFHLRHRKITPFFLIAIIPLLYLLYLGIQAPFNRYFILILPYTYIAISSYLWKKLAK